MAAVLARGVFCCDGTAVRVGVEEQERLEMTFDAFGDHVFPPGADLKQNKRW